MTLCAGWITGDHAFLLVDSAVTVEGGRVTEQIEVSTTTFGETEISRPGSVIVEGAAKLFQLSEHVVAAFAGETEPAYPVLNLLQHDLRSGVDIYTALERVRDRIKGFALGVAGTDRGAPRLWLAVDGTIREVYEPNRVWVWGPSRASGLREQVQQLIGLVAVEDPEIFMARALAAVQVPLASSGSIASGVGGACFGAYVSRDGLRTSEEAAYVYYDHGRLPEIDMRRIVVSGWRLGAQYSQAFIKGDKGVFSPQTTVFESDEHFTDRGALLNAAQSLDHAFPKPRYATLVDKRTGTMAFVPIEERDDLMKVAIGTDRLECHVRSNLFIWIDSLIRSVPPGAYGVLCVTKNSPPRIP